MPVPVLLIVVIVLFVGLLFVADRAVKAIKRVRAGCSASSSSNTGHRVSNVAGSDL